MGPESLKLIKLGDNDDIEAFLTTFERAAEAHGVERGTWAAVLAPQLTAKARLAYAAMNDQDAGHYDRVKAAIFHRYDINEETYRRRFRELTPKENGTPVELVIHVRDLADKWLKGCADRATVIDQLVREQFISVLPEEVRVWVKERKPWSSEEAEAGRLAENYRPARKSDLWALGVQPNRNNPKVCFSCQQPGHLAKDCPKKTVLGKGEDATKADLSTK